MLRLLALVVVYSMIAVPARLIAQEDAPQDAEGCKDSPIITRMPGSTIHSCENKEYEQVKMPVAKNKDGEVTEKTLEGEFHSWDYGTREGVSEIQVFRNFENALKTAGFTVDYASSPGQLLAHKGNTWIFIDNRGTYYNQTIVTEKQMQQEVAADASSLGDEINKTG